MSKVAPRPKSAKKAPARRTVELDVATARRFEFLLSCLLDDDKWNGANINCDNIGRLHRRMVRLLRAEEIQLAVSAAVNGAAAPANDNGTPGEAAPTRTVPTLALQPFHPAQDEELQRARRWLGEIQALADLVKRKSAALLTDNEGRTFGVVDQLGHVHWDMLAIAASFFDSKETGNLERRRALEEASLLDDDGGPIHASAGGR